MKTSCAKQALGLDLRLSQKGRLCSSVPPGKPRSAAGGRAGEGQTLPRKARVGPRASPAQLGAGSLKGASRTLDFIWSSRKRLKLGKQRINHT